MKFLMSFYKIQHGICIRVQMLFLCNNTLNEMYYSYCKILSLSSQLFFLHFIDSFVFLVYNIWIYINFGGVEIDTYRL